MNMPAPVTTAPAPRGPDWPAWRDRLRGLSSWGWPAAAGAALLLAGLAATLVATPALQQHAQELEDQALQMRRQALRRVQQAGAPADDAAAAQAFRAAFVPPAARAARVAALLALAEQHGLTVRRSEFRHQGDAALGIARYRITLPAEGSYDALRAFVVDSLRSDAALALDALRLTRADGAAGAAGALRAELRYTLYTQFDADAGVGAQRR